jgi:hypothetical protein
MACGNNHVTRDYLSSAPSTAAATATAALQRARQSAAAISPTAKVPRGWVSRNYTVLPGTSTRDPNRDFVERMVDKNGNPIAASHYPHIHVIHDENNGLVKAHITTSPGRHSDGVELKGNPSGNVVNAAVDMLGDILRGLEM